MANPNVTFSIGFVEGYLEELIKEGDSTAKPVLEHLHAIEVALNDAMESVRTQATQLDAIQSNLNGWKKI